MQIIPYLKGKLRETGIAANEKIISVWLEEDNDLLDRQYNVGTAMRDLRNISKKDPDNSIHQKKMIEESGRVKRLEGPYAVYIWELLYKFPFKILEAKKPLKIEPEAIPMFEDMDYGKLPEPDYSFLKNY